MMEGKIEVWHFSQKQRVYESQREGRQGERSRG